MITGSDGPGSGNVDGINGDRPNLLDPAVLGRSIDNPDTSTALVAPLGFRSDRSRTVARKSGFNTFRRGGIRNLNASLARFVDLPLRVAPDLPLPNRSTSSTHLSSPTPTRT